MKNAVRYFVPCTGAAVVIYVAAINYQSISMLPMQFGILLPNIIPHIIFFFITKKFNHAAVIVVTGAVILAAQGWVLAAFLLSKSSTAAVIFIFSPIFILGAAVIVFSMTVLVLHLMKKEYKS